MPIIQIPYKTPPFVHRSGHLSTVLPTLSRAVKPIYDKRFRLNTKDNDFFDVDFLGGIDGPSTNAAILLHGLEGSSFSKYILGMAHQLSRDSIDVYALNHRGCSGEINRNLYSYHSGFTRDLRFLIKLLDRRHKTIFLIGFSLGGNILLKYLGETSSVPNSVRAALAFGVPVDLESSAYHLARFQNSIYMRRFITQLQEKVRQKNAAGLSVPHYERIMKSKNFLEFDNYFTAPANGFRDAEDYWRSCSSKPFLSSIQTPTLLVNAENDPFLPKPCYPVVEAVRSENLSLFIPKHGGHIGFYKGGGRYFSEEIALRFLKAYR